MYKGYSARKLIGDFPEKGWKLRSLNYLLKKLSTVRVELLRRETPNFIAPDLWLSNSPDRNPVDYRIWAVLQERVYQQPVQDVDELKRRLIDCWSSIQQAIIDQAIDQWRVRLRACIRAKGGQFEQLLYVFVLHCLLTVIFQFCYSVFHLNVRDNNDDVPALSLIHIWRCRRRG